MPFILFSVCFVPSLSLSFPLESLTLRNGTQPLGFTQIFSIPFFVFPYVLSPPLSSSSLSPSGLPTAMLPLKFLGFRSTLKVCARPSSILPSMAYTEAIAYNIKSPTVRTPLPPLSSAFLFFLSCFIVSNII